MAAESVTDVVVEEVNEDDLIRNKIGAVVETVGDVVKSDSGGNGEGMNGKFLLQEAKSETGIAVRRVVSFEDKRTDGKTDAKDEHLLVELRNFMPPFIRLDHILRIAEFGFCVNCVVGGWIPNKLDLVSYSPPIVLRMFDNCF